MEFDITNINLAQTLYLETEETTSRGAWNITLRRVVIRIGVKVSGAGAWARLQGSTTLSTRVLESSLTYQQLQKEQCISPGIKGFWSWLADGVNASFFAKQLSAMFDELYREPNVPIKVEFDFLVTGIYPNVPIEVSPSIEIMKVRMNDGDVFLVMSSESPCTDTGAVNSRDNTRVPIMNNNTKIIKDG